MNNTLAVEQNPAELAPSHVVRASFAAAFIIGGLVLLYLASRYVRRHHKGRKHNRY